MSKQSPKRLTYNKLDVKQPSDAPGILARARKWFSGSVASGIIIGILLFIVFNFYVFASIVDLDSFFYAFLLLSILTDGLLVLVHVQRRAVKQRKYYYEASKLTVVIACYNGQDVIAQTIAAAHKHVPMDRIIVVSDASTDKTNEIVKQSGARLIVNQTNLHKVRSIDAGVAQVTTPYVLILDDDTLIDKTFIPTSMLDEGYTAVAFNVMPIPKKTILNELQRFEYRSTMTLSKQLRASVGAIGNVSGAIGLYRTKDLKQQFTLHSGQFAGEDEQRTLLAHMQGEGKGVAYIDSEVRTLAPATYKALFKQRAFSWSLSVPELLFLYARVIMSPRFHFTLKAEKAYQVYIYLTDPLRMLFLWTLIMRPSHLIYTYGFYMILNIIIWLRTGAKDRFLVVALTPVYTLCLTICRFIGYFYWLKVKIQYLAQGLHKPVHNRKLLAEYAMVFMVIAASWYVSVMNFRSDLHLFNKIRSERLNDNESQFAYVESPGLIPNGIARSADDSTIAIFMVQGDNARVVAHKAVDQFMLDTQQLVTLTDAQRWQVDKRVAQSIALADNSSRNVVVQVPKDVIREALQMVDNQQLSQQSPQVVDATKGTL